MLKKKIKRRKRRFWILTISNLKRGKYIQIGYLKQKGPKFSVRTGLGYAHTFEKYQKDAVKKIKKFVRHIPISVEVDELLKLVKEKFLNNDVILYQYYEKHIGFQLVCDFLNHFDIFNDPEQLKLNNINTAMKNQINFSNRSKILQIHNNKTDSYLSLFKLFDYLFKNKDEILRRLNTFLANKQKSQLN
ncbi:hypothetical protein C4M83_03955, partial [Mycoplasmopsis pullorum]